MTKNVGFLDRSLRFIIGVTLVTWAIAGGPFWTWIGLIPLATASWGLCPLYSALGISSIWKKRS
ncbi:MAG: DUF2892 domain-containing protein [Bdellovibrionales bacterium]|nr:DUF2892 domain-containing protein [Bdellovibrionales bacterium]